MKGMFSFVVQPYGERYDNKKDIDGVSFILNTELQNHSYVNRIGIVKYAAIDNPNNIQPGDLVIVHHNVFRRFRDIRGIEKNSKSFYEEDTYFVQPDQIFAFKKDNGWESCIGFNFVKPIPQDDDFSIEKEKPLVGIIETVDPELKDITKGDIVGFRPNSEYEFIIDEQKLYRVPTNSITIKYGQEGNKVKNNISRAPSC